MRHVSPIESLVAAVLKANGDGLVMHVGERPYVLAPNGSADLSERPLTVEAMKGVLGDLLSIDDQRILSDVGAVEREILPKDAPGDKFVLVAARGGDDIWIELRRQRGVIRMPQPAPAPVAPPVPDVPPPEPVVQPQPATPPPQAQAPAAQPVEAVPATAAAPPIAENPPVAEAPSPAPARTAPTHHVQVPETAPRPRMAPNHSAAQAQSPSPVATAPRATAPVPPPARADEPSNPPPSARRTGPVRDTPSGVVLPLARSPIRTDTPRAGATPTPRYLGIGRLLRIASARGASSLFLTANARPSIRLDDEILPLETEPPLGKAEVEALILELAPGASREAFAGGTSAEWVYELQDVGRVRCVSFRDQRGPGAVFRLIPTRLISADQLGLSRDIQALCSEREGLVIVAGPRLSGKSTLISAFVDLINRSRSDYIISLETEIKFVHENRRAMVSQREARGEPDAMLTGARAALRENPDVLVIDDLKTPDLVAVALDAAESGHLVIGAITAHTTSAAIGRLVETAPYEKQTQVALSLSEALRGAVAQVLLRKSGGGRVAARELLFNMPSVGALIAEGKISQLPLAIDSGRKYGMVPMNDVLLAFVQSGAVDPREAYRKAYDRVAFLDLLKREGIDTSFVERLA
jgi:twitching motility protein PilT